MKCLKTVEENPQQMRFLHLLMWKLLVGLSQLLNSVLRYLTFLGRNFFPYYLSFEQCIIMYLIVMERLNSSKWASFISSRTSSIFLASNLNFCFPRGYALDTSYNNETCHTDVRSPSSDIFAPCTKSRFNDTFTCFSSQKNLSKYVHLGRDSETTGLGKAVVSTKFRIT